jgi:2-keto-4-pentenoate hydratase/2-oxohepta-3-ene-1,7-dioic acid hydratase in catechol pathway
LDKGSLTVRWVCCSVDGRAQLGVLAGDAVHLLAEQTTLLALLEAGRVEEAGEHALAGPAQVLPLASAMLRAPLDRPPSIRDFMAFEQHVESVGRLAGAGVPDVWYDQPLFYFTNPAAVVGPYDDVAIPPGCEVFDFELEVAAVVGVAGSDLTLAEAERAIAGYLILNDWSARDLQFAEMRGPLGPCKGKDSTITLGPWFVTADELVSAETAPEMAAWVNDELIGRDRLDSMSWSFPEMVAYASRGTTLRAGDVVGSGTCGGGCLAELWGRRGRAAHSSLRPGDVVRLSVGGLGETRNRVVAGGPVRQPLARRRRATETNGTAPLPKYGA